MKKQYIPEIRAVTFNGVIFLLQKYFRFRVLITVVFQLFINKKDYVILVKTFYEKMR